MSINFVFSLLFSQGLNKKKLQAIKSRFYQREL